MRFALILAWVAVVVALVLPFFRRRAVAAAPDAPGVPAGALRDELVKDPVCQTYVLMSRAIRSEAGGAPLFFCSRECAARFQRGERRA